MDYYGIQIIPLIVGLVSILKRLGVPNKYLPLCSLLLGLFFSFILSEDRWEKVLVTGLYFGLSSVGLYSGSKNLLEGSKKVKE